MKEIQCGKTGRGRDYISEVIYDPYVQYDKTNILLNHTLTVYGMRHPSSKCGYDPEKYSVFLKSKLN